MPRGGRKPRPQPTPAPAPVPEPATPTGSTVDIPASIPADGSRPVERDLLDFIGRVPNNTTLRFQAGGVYGIDGRLYVPDRTGLTFDGNGATFKTLTLRDGQRCHWMFRGGGAITLRNMTCRGFNPNAGITDTAYDSRYEYQHAYDFGGVNGATLDNCKAYDVYGDFVEATADSRAGTPVAQWIPTRDLVVKNCHFERNGRMGMGVTDVIGLTVENTYFGECNMAVIDLEADDPAEFLQHITIKGCTLGRHRDAFVAGWGAVFGANWGPLAIVDNVETVNAVTCEAPVTIRPLDHWPATAYRDGITVTGNHFITASDGVYLLQCRKALIADNHVEHRDGGCGRLDGVVMSNSHDFTITTNRFQAARSVYRAVDGSTPPTHSGNVLL